MREGIGKENRKKMRKERIGNDFSKKKWEMREKRRCIKRWKNK